MHEGEAAKRQDAIYCVGHSVINYFLNGFVIANLSAIRDQKDSVEVMNISSACCGGQPVYRKDKVGLEVTCLTLSDCAINVAFSKDLRLLNLAMALSEQELPLCITGRKV